MRALEAEIAKFQTQNRLAEDARRAAEAAANQLASDRAAFEQAKAADTAVLEEQKGEVRASRVTGRLGCACMQNEN